MWSFKTGETLPSQKTICERTHLSKVKNNNNIKLQAIKISYSLINKYKHLQYRLSRTYTMCIKSDETTIISWPSHLYRNVLDCSCDTWKNILIFILEQLLCPQNNTEVPPIIQSHKWCGASKSKRFKTIKAWPQSKRSTEIQMSFKATRVNDENEALTCV